MVHCVLFVWCIVEFVRWVYQTAVEVRAQGSNYIPQFDMDVITHACLHMMQVNSSAASATYLRQRTGLALVYLDNCLSPVRRQAITGINANLLSIRP